MCSEPLAHVCAVMFMQHFSLLSLHFIALWGFLALHSHLLLYFVSLLHFLKVVHVTCQYR